MTVFCTIAANQKNYTGLSTDTKPTDATTPYGSYFFETDTLKNYVYSSSGLWVYVPGSGGGSSLSDLLYTDDTGTVFVYRDTGSGTLTAVNVPAGTAYTVGANPRPYSPPTLSTASGTGTVTTGTSSAFACVGQGTAVFVVSGTWSGTIIVEATNDNTNWFTTSYVSVATGNTSTTFTANTQGQINTVGFLSVRLRSNTVASGTANVVWTSAPAVSNVMLDNPLPAGSNTIGAVNLNTGSNIIGRTGSDLTTYGTTNSVFVGGTSQVQVTPTVTSASAYAANNVVGGLLTFANAVQSTVLSGVITSVSVAVKSTQTAGFKLYLFSASPAGTFTNKTAGAIATADASLLLDVITLGAADSGLGSNVTIYNTDAISRSVVLAGTSLYGVLITTGTPTFTTTTDVVVTVSILKD